MLPRVLLFPIPEKRVLDNTIPAETLVLTRLVDVMLTTVRVPATLMSPERCTDPALIVVAATRVELTVPMFPRVASIVPDVIPVARMLVVVMLVLLK